MHPLTHYFNTHPLSSFIQAIYLHIIGVTGLFKSVKLITDFSLRLPPILLTYRT